MRTIPGPVLALFLVATTAGAAQAQQICVEIDAPRDTLDPQDRAAAVLLLTRQFTLAGEDVVASCPTPYLVSHVKLGNTITVTITGPKGTREGTALGLDDLPALYSQMVRSLETGRPMTGPGVVDRTNVTVAQATSAPRVRSDGFWYARLGYGGIFADRAYGAPAFGFGYRAELDKMAIDVSFLNTQMGSSNYYSSGARSASLLKLSGLYLLKRESNSTPYFGGGLSWGNTNISASEPYTYAPGTPTGPPAYFNTGGNGSGLQGEVTAGYEFGRATTIRLFVQADAILPFYSVNTQTISSRGGIVSSRGSVRAFARHVGGAWVAAQSQIGEARPLDVC